VVEPPPGHAAGALGAAIVGLGRAVTIQLDADNPRGLDDAMESVLAATIAAVALAPRESP
jgi:isopentenyl diphosphate isomerase/L-lactate dehydrogenase-like FMN-dependent dehydrogenase